MLSIQVLKNWIQYFLLPLSLFLILSAVAFAEDPPVIATPAAPIATATFSSSNAAYISALESAINDYKQLAANGGWEKFPIGKNIKINSRDSRIPAIRQTLAIMGDYSGELNLSSDKLDNNLSEAVKHFQARHGLEQDGAIGQKTQNALAVPVEERIAQMENSLENMRKMPELGDHYILVNVAGFYLKAVDKNKTILTSRIIVGNPKNATPLFTKPITEISFNPQWHVPERIAKTEFASKLRKDPSYLSKGNYFVTTHNGKKIDANSIDWQKQSGKMNYRFIQRALSHGCIRVERILELAYFVMNGMSDWNEARIAKLYEGNTSKIIPITPVPVYLSYWTSWVDEDSKQPNFYPDIYGYDKKRIAELPQDKAGKTNSEVKLAMN